MIPLREFITSAGHFVVAHRGSSGTAPENTLAAIRQALDAKAKMVEIDVHVTSDNHPILLHDNVIGRTTAGHGRLAAMPLDELRGLDAGSWFHPDFRGEKIPLLTDALALLRGNAYLNIEIKPPTPNEDYAAHLETIIHTVDASGMTPYTLFSSFHHTSLKQLKIRYPALHTAAINIPGDKRLPSVIADEIACEGIVYGLRELTFAKMQDAAERGIYVGAYVVNNSEDLQRALRYGVRAIASNFPARIMGLLEEITTPNINSLS